MEEATSLFFILVKLHLLDIQGYEVKSRSLYRRDIECYFKVKALDLVLYLQQDLHKSSLSSDTETLYVVYQF